MKRAGYVALLVGLAIPAYIVVHAQVRTILALVADAGWILLCLVPLYGLPECLGWRSLIPPPPRVAVLCWPRSSDWDRR